MKPARRESRQAPIPLYAIFCSLFMTRLTAGFVRLLVFAGIGVQILYCQQIDSSTPQGLGTKLGSNLAITGSAKTPEENYRQYCSSCHGAGMQAFVDRVWEYGKTYDAILESVRDGRGEGEEPDMPSFSVTFTEKELGELVCYILEGIENVELYDFEDEPTKDIYTAGSFRFSLEPIIEGIGIPWGLAFLPGGDLLVTEREGRLLRVSPLGKTRVIRGVPSVSKLGQGGLLDVELHPEFEQNQWLYLSYSALLEGSGRQALTTTRVCRYRLRDNELSEELEILLAKPFSKARIHYGSRLEFDREGFLYVSVGDRGARDRNPQSLESDCGKVHRFHDDGSIPMDNPFADQKNAIGSIFTLGHRNPQGMTLHPGSGAIWIHEHGPRGGDEVNILERGKNYGWPLISYGINYDGTVFTSETHREGLQQPLLYWVPSIAPCGMDFVEGDKYPGWEGALMSGSLRFEYLNLAVVRDSKIVSEEFVLENVGRVRNVRMGIDGYVYVAVENPGRILKLIPR